MQWHLQSFAGHESLRKDLLCQEPMFSQGLVGRGRIMVEQKQPILPSQGLSVTTYGSCRDEEPRQSFGL